MIFLETSTIGQPNITSTPEPPSQGDEAKYLIVPLVVIALVMLLSLLVYCMAKRRKMNKLRRDIAKLYEFDEKDLECETLNSYECPNYNTNEFTPFARGGGRGGGYSYMPTTNL